MEVPSFYGESLWSGPPPAPPKRCDLPNPMTCRHVGTGTRTHGLKAREAGPKSREGVHRWLNRPPANGSAVSRPGRFWLGCRECPRWGYIPVTICARLYPQHTVNNCKNCDPRRVFQDSLGWHCIHRASFFSRKSLIAPQNGHFFPAARPPSGAHWGGTDLHFSLLTVPH